MSTDQATNTPIEYVAVFETERSDLESHARDVYNLADELPEAEAVDVALEASRDLKDDGLSRIAARLGRFATHTGAPVLIIHGPEPDAETLPPTPLRHLEPHENPKILADYQRLILLGLVSHWYPYGYTSQQPGNIHNNVVAVEADFGVRGVSANPLHELDLHTEDASYNHSKQHNISPDFLSLHFLRNPDDVPSIVSTPDFSQLSEAAREILFSQFFYNHTNPSQGGDNNTPMEPISVLYGDPTNPRIRLNTSKLDMERYQPHQRKALSDLADLVTASTVELPAISGDIVLVDNHRVLHGRAKYQPHQMPRFDGRDRWQRRVVVADKAERIQPFEVKGMPRIVDPQIMLRSLAAR